MIRNSIMAASILICTASNADLTTSVLDAGGARSSSGNVLNDGSLGGIGGVSTQSVTTSKHSYIGQLYELEALQLAASPLTVNENGTRQISATLVLDDATTLAAASGFTWSVTAGPLTIDSNGLASGLPVYQDTLATAQASAGSAIGTLDLTVINNLSDNFGSYAADGIDDDWQFLYFGLNNPNAGPLIDPDFDGQDNLFEFTAGIVPTDPNSRFQISARGVAGQPTHKEIVFSPRFSDRSYAIEFSTTLQSESWLPLAGTDFSDSGTERTVTDLNAIGFRKFYRVQISRPD